MRLTIDIMLNETAAAGGEILVFEMHCCPYDLEAESLELISMQLLGGGFGVMASLALTAKARKQLGLPVEETSFKTRVLRFIGIPMH